jgi:hypothetical protein
MAVVNDPRAIVASAAVAVSGDRELLSIAGPFSYVVTHNHATKQWTASFKRQSGGGNTKFIGTFADGTAAYEACEKHYRAGIS